MSADPRLLERPVALFDGSCNFCVTAVGQLREFDTDARIEWLDLHAPGVRERFPRIDWSRAEEEIHLIHRDGRVRTGARAMRDVLEIIDTPAARAAVGAMDIPGAAPIADFVYKFIADNRHEIMGRRKAEGGGDPC